MHQHTSLITDYMPTVLECLSYECGKVSSEEVSQKKSEVIFATWLPSDPIMLIVMPLEHLKNLSEHTRTPYEDVQTLEKGLSLVRVTRDF